MITKITRNENTGTIEKVETDDFCWNLYDGTNGNQLLHKKTGRNIYKMHWCTDAGKMTTRVDDDVSNAVTAFWDELDKLQSQKPTRPSAIVDSEPQHGQSGYCRKCHSYCWGDCSAQ
jgi:hypothetical protein